MQLGRRIRVRAGSGCLAGDPNLGLFSATLAQNAGLNARVQLPMGLAAGTSGMCVIRDIQVVSVDGNIWEFWFWRNSLFQESAGGKTTAPGESWAGSYAFAAAGLQIAGTGLYYANATLLDIFYEDEDAMTAQVSTGLCSSNGQSSQLAFLNVTLINRSVGAKTASGWFDVSFVCEPTVGW